MRLGTRIRKRRKRLRMSQQALAEGRWTRSYISQVELNKIIPSLETLSEIAHRLDTPTGDLIGDGILLRAAKATLLTPALCSSFLEHLPETRTTRVLKELTQAVAENRPADVELPPNAELHYLAVKVHIFQGRYKQAVETLKDALKFADEFWRIRFCYLLSYCWEQLGNPEEMEKARQQFDQAMRAIDNLDDLRQEALKQLKSATCEDLPMDTLEFLQGIDLAQELQGIMDLKQSPR